MGMIQTFVTRKEETHQYFDQNGLEYMSVSRFLDFITPFFDRQLMLSLSAKKQGKTIEELDLEWKASAYKAQQHGTRIHNAIERYLLTAKIDAGNEDLEFLIKTICSSYNEYYRVMPEEIIYSPEFRIAGASDLVLRCKSSANGYFDIEDFKTNVSKGIEFYSKYGKRMLHPIEHLEDCNFVKYSFQLSLYAYMVEKITGWKLRRMNIVFIPPENILAWKRIPVMYMKTDVENCLNFYKGAILEKLNKNVNFG